MRRVVVTGLGLVTPLGGDVEIAAGSPADSGGDDGRASAARFARLLALACGDDGSCYVADGARVRRFDGGRVETLAGSAPGFADAEGVAARFGAIRAIASAGGKLYVADVEYGRVYRFSVELPEPSAQQ